MSTRQMALTAALLALAWLTGCAHVRNTIYNVGADAADHRGRVAEPRQRVDGVGCLAATRPHRIRVGERRVDPRAQTGVHDLLGAGRPELAPQREAARQAVDHVEIEGAAADQVDRPHTCSSPR